MSQEMSPAPLLSICIPTFNRAWLLERNLTFHLEVFRHRGIAFEIVVVDDCSTDDTSAYLKSLDAPELSIYHRHKNSGFLDNYAFAMRRARGLYAIFLGDDDLLVPDQVIAYLARLQADPSIGMIQAPWMEVDERPGGVGDMGPFYKIPSEARFAKGSHAGLAQYLFDFHVFPEFMIVRRDVLARSISSACPFVFWAFLFTGRALGHADIVFCPTPFARVTALSDDPRMRQGNKETMFLWDHYRGGLEFIIGQAMRTSTAPMETRTATTDAITRFMMMRQKVAVRLLLHAGHWAEAHTLIQRIMAYDPLPVTPQQMTEISHMAGFSTAAKDAANVSEAPAIVDPAIGGNLLGTLPPDIRARLLPAGSAPHQVGPRTYLRLDPAFPPHLAANDTVIDVADYIAQFA